MKTVSYTSHLTQEKLTNVLKDALFEKCSVFLTEAKVTGKPQCRWDVYFETHTGKKIAVEFDGDAHYRDTTVIALDYEKDTLALEQEILVVRIPYWIQLTDETAQYWFGDLFDGVHIEQDYPHGFIKSKIFPASYCAIGVERFVDEFFTIPEGVFKDVIDNMLGHATSDKYDFPLVFPGELVAFLNDVFKDYGMRFENMNGICTPIEG